MHKHVSKLNLANILRSIDQIRFPAVISKNKSTVCLKSYKIQKKKNYDVFTIYFSNRYVEKYA